jgi:signal transduction histidine kinase
MTTSSNRQASPAVAAGSHDSARARDALRRLALNGILACEDLRTKITQVLHDELGQALAVLNFHLFWLSRRCPGDTELRDKIGEMRQIVSSTHQSIALIARDCRPLLAAPGATLADIVDCLVRRFRDSQRIDCELHMPHTLPTVSHDDIVTVAYLLARCLDAFAARGMPGGLRVGFGYRDGSCTIGIVAGDSRVRASFDCADDLPDLTGVATMVEALGGSCVAACGDAGEFDLRIALPLPREDVRGI